MDVWVPTLLGLEEAPAPGEDQVGPAKELILERAEPLGRVGERRELVHAVVDESERIERARERKRHGRIEPEHESLDEEVVEEAPEQPLLDLVCLLGCASLRKLRDGDDDPLAQMSDVQVRSARGSENRLLHEEHTALARTAGEELLRTLPDEVPAEMGHADEVEVGHAPSECCGWSRPVTTSFLTSRHHS